MYHVSFDGYSLMYTYSYVLQYVYISVYVSDHSCLQMAGEDGGRGCVIHHQRPSLPSQVGVCVGAMSWARGAWVGGATAHSLYTNWAVIKRMKALL